MRGNRCVEMVKMKGGDGWTGGIGVMSVGIGTIHCLAGMHLKSPCSRCIVPAVVVKLDTFISRAVYKAITPNQAFISSLNTPN